MTPTEGNNRSERPNLIAWPPIFLVIFAAIALGLETIIPAEDVVGAVPPGLRPVGMLIVILAAAGDAWAIWTMWRAKTNVMPTKAARNLVTTGPFAYSRNPIYLCNTFALFGLALALNNAWFIYAAIAFACCVRLLAIKREEEHLAARFGNDWEVYKGLVPRWLIYW